jgi:hypothetical protein
MVKILKGPNPVRPSNSLKKISKPRALLIQRKAPIKRKKYGEKMRLLKNHKKRKNTTREYKHQKT